MSSKKRRFILLISITIIISIPIITCELLKKTNEQMYVGENSIYTEALTFQQEGKYQEAIEKYKCISKGNHKLYDKSQSAIKKCEILAIVTDPRPLEEIQRDAMIKRLKELEQQNGN